MFVYSKINPLFLLVILLFTINKATAVFSKESTMLLLSKLSIFFPVDDSAIEEFKESPVYYINLYALKSDQGTKECKSCRKTDFTTLKHLELQQPAQYSNIKRIFSNETVEVGPVGQDLIETVDKQLYTGD